jgi:hypothetical protein
MTGPLPRRHYLRVSSEPHAGTARRVESLLRRSGLQVQNRGMRGDDGRMHLGFLTSPCDDDHIAEVEAAIRRLGRVQHVLSLGVAE